MKKFLKMFYLNLKTEEEVFLVFFWRKFLIFAIRFIFPEGLRNEV